MPLTPVMTSDRPSGARTGPVWALAGFVLAVVLFFGTTAWVMIAPAPGIAAAGDALIVEVRGQLWWWEVRYPGEPAVVTANEIRIPLGRPVELRLTSDNVIHSFWVPALGGKTDMIPGQTNRMTLLADRAGVYRGQCAEFCGLQHAQMAFMTVVQTPEDFEAWRRAQAAPAAAVPEDARRGAELFVLRCGACHTVRGTEAQGVLGPDLTHLRSRLSIAAGMLPNSTGHRAGWTANPQTLKPGSLMPNLDLPASELAAITLYLETLR